jgi:uncharacterized membrane protein
MHKQSIILGLLGWVVLSPRGSARPTEYQVNIREGCRQAVAGAYLKVYDERERLRTYIIALNDQLKSLTPLLESARKADIAAAKALEKTAFETNVVAKRGEAAAHLKVLEDQHRETTILKTRAELDHKKYVAEEASLKAAILPVFSFERLEDKPDGGYPVHLHYRSGCPKYRHLCPLPAKDTAALLAIKIDGKVPEPCERYAGLSRLR